jgi:HK97 family phage major capsid protein
MTETLTRRRAFTGPNAERDATIAGHWLKSLAGIEASRQWCMDRNIGLIKASNEGVNTAGGFLAPVEFDRAISVLRDTVGAFRLGAEVRPATSDGQVRPRRVGALTANFVVPEGTAITESALTFDAIETVQKKIGILARCSNELFYDSAPDLAEFVATEIAYAFAAKEDDCGFNGDGTSAYGGIQGLGTKLTGMASSVAAASGHHTYLTLDTTDIANLMAGVLSVAIPGAAWYCSATGYAQTLCRLAAVAGALVARKRANGTIDASYLGFPVIFSSKLPDTPGATLTGSPMLYFGDLRLSSVLVEREPHTIFAMSQHRYLDLDQTLLRGTSRIDIVNHQTGTATVKAPVAMLVGTA